MSWIALSDSKEILRELDGDESYQQLGIKTDNIIEQQQNDTELEINLLVNQILLSNGTGDSDSERWLESSTVPLSNWQKSQLESVKDSGSGIRCLLNSWLVFQKNILEGSFCNATWDNVYCWPPTPLGTTVNRTCLHAFTETQPLYAPHLEGHGYRVCLANGSWLWGGWTNYSECADSYDVFVDNAVKHIGESRLVTIVQYILFIGSVLSLICLSSAVSIFYYFRVLWCDRVTIHTHLMVALMLRYIMLFIITEPFIFERATNYRSVDIICKGVLIVYLYATLTSINWMFIQGIYINGKLTTNVFQGRTPFKVYYTIGWLLPAVLMSIWSFIMFFNHDEHCWSGYAKMNEIWLIICPIILALVVTFLFLINILRILVTKVHTPGQNTDAMHFRRAAKSTIFLFPLLGINNLLFLYNPGGDLHKYFVILNTFFGSTQGIFVAIGYCYLSKDVRAAFVRLCRRFMARRNANLIRRRAKPRIRQGTRFTATSSMIKEQPRNSRNNPRRVLLIITTSQLSPSNCYESCSTNDSLSCSQRPSQVSNSPSQKSSCQEIVDSDAIANAHESRHEYCVTSPGSHSSYRICVNTSNTSVEYRPMYSSFRSSEGSSKLVSPEHPWSNCGKALAAPEMLGSGEPGKNIFCKAAIPVAELN